MKNAALASKQAATANDHRIARNKTARNLGCGEKAIGCNGHELVHGVIDNCTACDEVFDAKNSPELIKALARIEPKISAKCAPNAIHNTTATAHANEHFWQKDGEFMRREAPRYC